jgi:hypothetical protein
LEVVVHLHHIIPKHEWKKRFGNLCGVNAPDNVIYLTIEQHTEIHRRMGEEGSKWDQIAASGLAKEIDNEEIIKLKQTIPNIGRRLSEKSRRQIAERFIGTKLSKDHKKRIKEGVILRFSEPEFRERQRKGVSKPGKTNPFYGKNHSEDFKQRRSKEMRGISKPRVLCPHCKIEGGKPIMSRFHFDKCKRRM